MSTRRFEHTHDHSAELTADGKPESLQRVEIITGVGRRRRFSPDTKARIVLESQAPGAVVSEVARRHGLSPQQLFTWRREFRAGLRLGTKVPDTARAEANAFAPVVVVADGTDQRPPEHTRRPTERGVIEIIIGEVHIRLRDGIALRTLAAVLKAVRVTS
jgi:transposase